MQITTKELIEKVLGPAQQYVKRFPKERSSLTFVLQSKIPAKYKKIQDGVTERLNTLREELEVKHCLKKDGAFVEKEIVVGNQVVFRKSFDEKGEKARRDEYEKAEAAILAEPVEFEPYKVALPAGIDISWYEVFKGYVFEELTEEQLEKWFFSQAEPEKPKDK